MVRIAPIRLAYNPKTLWFDPGDLELGKEDPVVVSTARGLEFGRMADDVFEADEAQVKKLKTALKPVKRLASEEDVARAEEMCRRCVDTMMDVLAGREAARETLLTPRLIRRETTR